MSAVVASRPATLIWAPGPNSTPLGLTIHTWPLADKLPRMAEDETPPTRLSVMDSASGCLKLMDSLSPSEKLRQSMMALPEVWRIMVSNAEVEIAAWPAITWAPDGPAQTGLPAEETMQVVINKAARRACLCCRRCQIKTGMPLIPRMAAEHPAAIPSAPQSLRSLYVFVHGGSNMGLNPRSRTLPVNPPGIYQKYKFSF